MRRLDGLTERTATRDRIQKGGAAVERFRTKDAAERKVDELAAEGVGARVVREVVRGLEDEPWVVVLTDPTAGIDERTATASGWERVHGLVRPIKVYDNGGESFDRYTVVLDEPGTNRGDDFMALGLSDNPGHPQGFSQFTTAQDGPHLGKRIKFADLPDEVRKHAVVRLKDEVAVESAGGRRLAGLGERAASKGAAYFPSAEAARKWAASHNWPTDQITKQDKGWTVHNRATGTTLPAWSVATTGRQVWKQGAGWAEAHERGRKLAGLNERASEHWAVIAYDSDEARMDIFRRELEKHDIEAEVEPVMTARGERYDLLVRQSKQAEANKILTDMHGRGLSRNRAYKLPNVPEESPFGEATPAASDLDHDIEREIGRWLESGAEFELGDINEPVDFAPTSPAERRVLEKNVLFIVLRELEKKVGKLPPRTVTVEILRGAVESEKDDDNYRAIGHFRIWHAGDSYAQGSLTAEGVAGELQNMTINIIQASGHGKKNTPLRFFG
jgi:hypothetical protein